MKVKIIDCSYNSLRDNNYGQLGNNMQAEAETPLFHDNLPPITYIACGTNHNLALDGTPVLTVLFFNCLLYA